MRFALGLMLALCLWGQPDRYDFISPAPPPVPPANVSASVVGQRGVHTYYYWVVANYVIGHSLPSGPAIITDAPDALNVINYVQVRWSAMPSAVSYDVLRTTTAVRPQGACACAVAIATLVTTDNDIGNALSAYTVSSVPTATGYIRLNNRDYPAPVFEFYPSLFLIGYISFTCQVEPPCALAVRGLIVLVCGGVGVADTFRICTKDAAGAYAWRALY